MNRVSKYLASVCISCCAISLYAADASNTTNIKNTKNTKTTESNPTAQIDQLTQQMQLEKANNELLSEQVKSAKLQADLSNIQAHGDVADSSIQPSFSNDQASAHIGVVSNATKPRITGYIQGFKLLQVSGNANNPTAFIQYQGSVAQVQNGDVIADNWTVKRITSAYVLLENKAKKMTQKLYVAAPPQPSSERSDRNNFNQFN